MELSIVALAGIPAVSSLILDVAAAMRYHLALAMPLDPPVAELVPAPGSQEDERVEDAEPIEQALAARMWIRTTDPLLS